MRPPLVVCAGCGERVDPAARPPFRCPNARDGDGIDHVLAPEPAGPDAWAARDAGSDNPFVRYRRMSLAHRLAMARGMADDAFVALVADLDGAVARVDGAGFRLTPLRRAAAADRAGTRVWLKDETGNVAGSHKARHLFGVMIYLRVIAALGLPAARGLRDRPLAIASCGNAALAAAVVARAADWPIDVFIPDDADPAVVRRLGDLGARVHVERRAPGVAGDPCVLAFRRAVEAGAIPFGVQGNENGLAIEGGHTLGFELVEQCRAAGFAPAHLFVQVGGGALGSGLYQGLAAVSSGALPALHTVQTRGAWPLKRAHDRHLERFGAPFDPGALARAARERDAFMWPWEETPHSLAHGILDDETYDWLKLLEAMLRTGGRSLVVSEDRLVEAHALAVRLGLNASHTGAAALAGLIEAVASGLVGDGDAVATLTGVGSFQGHDI